MIRHQQHRAIDALAHLNDPRIVANVAVFLHNARHAGLTDVICGGVDPITDVRIADDVHDTLQPHLNVWYAYGIHPRLIGTHPLEQQLIALGTRLREPGVVAAGEMGLDARDGMPPMSLQRDAFVAQLDVAAALKLPVIVHCVRAMGPLLETLRARHGHGPGIMLHGFNGPAAMITPLLDLNVYFSFGGMVTYPSARRCRESAVRVPVDRLFVESDTPDHRPRSWEHPATNDVNLGLPTAQLHDAGARYSEPASIVTTLQHLAALRGADADVLAQLVGENSVRFFGF